MIETSMQQLARAIGGRLVGSDVQVSQVYTDGRRECPGGLFVALKGIHYDAHQFLDQAVAGGASGLVVEVESALPVTQIVVADSKRALGDLAKYNRERLNAKIAAITGSSGKTTVKEMLASILQNVGHVHATRGNLNNEIGAPLTLLEMNETHDFGVIELGANHAGEIAYTVALAQPQVAMINNVAAAHLEGFGDLQGVARAKGEIYAELGPEHTAVVNLDDQFADFWLKDITAKVLSFSVEKAADVVAKNISLDDEQRASFDLHYAGQIQAISLSLAGRHNVHNALAAAACALALNVALADIAKGLAQSPVVTGRLMSEMLENGCRLIDDTYNANVDSMRAAIKLLAGYPGRRVLVIGDMAELGQFGRECHQEVGAFARETGIDALYSCGVLTRVAQIEFGGAGQHFSGQQELIQTIKNEAKQGVTILVKGSRSSHMENVVSAILDMNENAEPQIASTEGDA